MTAEINDTNRILRIFHPIPKTQDGDCPHIRWMGEDLIHCPGIGEYKCMLQNYTHGEYDQNLDYQACNNTNHQKCLLRQDREITPQNTPHTKYQQLEFKF